ncbi:serine O-acetyltransferase EpsC [Flavobacterium qiangtangense]|uniref:Serine acetyltransferase n=1 Tax=Flavobacterium qiangtangense TaxID=1442595 RepID=A0ABW1PQY2_9FLAO
MSKNKSLYQSNFLQKRIFLNRKEAKYWINELSNWLFCSEKEYVNFTFFENKEIELQQLLKTLLEEESFAPNKALEIAENFFETINLIHKSLSEDLKAILEFDPAAKSRNEVLLAYPGFFAITVYRISHELWKQNALILSRLISEFAHSKTGIDIHPSAQIGERFFIDHGTGVVIGETTIIGNDVKVYQGVTLGALSVSKDKAAEKRHPTIEDDVIIYSNATILGGNTTIGKGAVIGGNVWITNSIPPESLVFHKSEIVIKSKQVFPEALNFSI